MYPQKFKLSTAVNPTWLEDVLPETQAILDSKKKTPMDVRTGQSSFPTLIPIIYHDLEAEDVFRLLRHFSSLGPS